MKTWRDKLFFIFLALVAATLAARSQTSSPPSSPTSLYRIFTNNPAALDLISNLLSEPPPEMSVPAASGQSTNHAGTYWTVQGAAVPLPFNPFSSLPVYAVGTNTYLIDDRSVDYPAFHALMEAESEASGLTNGTVGIYNINTNGLWLETTPDSLADDGQFKAILHNTIQGQSYDILTKSDLLYPAWAMELSMTGAVGNATEIELPRSGRTNLFVWAEVSTVYSFYLTTTPLSQYVAAGDTVTFSVATGGNTNLTYQWTFNGVPIAGATNSSYTLSNVQGDDGGDYACIVSDGTNTIITAAAHLSVEYGSGNPSRIAIFGQRQDYTFKSGITYYIPETVMLYGHTTIEGGAVIKPDWYYDAGLQVMGTLECKAEPYFPAILTSVDDDSVGEGLGFSDFDGPPFIVDNSVPYLDLAYAQSNTISNLRICFADWGVTTPATSRRLDVWDCQFIQCNYGIVNLVDGTGAKDSLHNVLFSGCNTAIGAATNAIDIEAEQITADAGNFCLFGITPNRIALTNCILFSSAPTAATLAAVGVVYAADGTNFVAVDAGNYYLAATSPFHHAGTVSISPRLKDELKGKTTYPPVAIAALTTLADEMTLAPQALRYTNGAPDLGYHYDALDYTVGMFDLKGGRLTILPGTAIGLRNEYSDAVGNYTWWGFWLEQDSVLVSRGLPGKPIIYADVQLVQEQPTPPCIATFVPYFIPSTASAIPPTLDFRFCRLYAVNGWYHIWSGYDAFFSYEPSPDSLVYWNMQDCSLRGGWINLGPPDDGSYFGAPMDFAYGSGMVAWTNNAFENVRFNLYPSFYWYNGATNCDLPIYAYNNLFRNSPLFLVEPNPTTAGNWIFKDNLFDRVDLIQDTTMPLDFDYNGYWPLLARELIWGGSDMAQLLPAASHEQVLSNATPYQAGAFGSFYLPTTTPLFGAGSRSPADAGLFQYTTRLDQTKEGDEAGGHMVNIGLHYVAASGTQPLDSDGDGIPDYREDANGNGLVDSGETDAHNAMTDGFNNDPTNSAYDDVDLDGDGLTGAAERFFGTNPTNADNPLNLLSVAPQSVMTGIVSIPLNLNTNVDTNAAILFMVDGVAQGTLVYRTNGQWFAAWDTTRFTNGTHQLNLQYDLDEDTPIIGAAKFVNAQNDICFPFANNLPLCGDSMYVQPQTIHTNGTYTLDVYGDQTNLIISINGDIDGNGYCLDPNTGQPGITVSLLDTNGDHLPFEAYTAVITATGASSESSSSGVHLNAASGGSSSASPTAFYSHPWGDHRWVIAYYPAYGDPEFGNNAALNLAEMMEGAATIVHSSSYGTADDAVVNDINTSAGNPLTISLTSSGKWNQLRSLLTDGRSRNFFYFGHGAVDFIGRKSSDKITSDDLQGILTNSASVNSTGWFSSQLSVRWEHPYRFVFLDGCNTAKGGLPLAFGIPNCEVSTDNWNNRVHSQPRAFLGWSSYTAASVKNTLPGDHRMFIENFWSSWGSNNGNQLKDSLTTAALNPENGQRFTSLDQKITLFGDPALPFYQ